jgi:heparan-alpha-glucosaminide N-acetyltransferase-like protein
MAFILKSGGCRNSYQEAVIRSKRKSRKKQQKTRIADCGLRNKQSVTKIAGAVALAVPQSAIGIPRFLLATSGSMGKSERIPEIDALRGLAIVLMALDHTRDYCGDHSIDALDLAHTSIALFLARWLTLFCAPTFVCLAGMSVAISAHGQPINRPFLLGLASRGLWLVALEQTLLRCFSWYFNFNYHYMNAGILWGTGWAMVFLALTLTLGTSVANTFHRSFVRQFGKILSLNRFLADDTWRHVLLSGADRFSAELNHPFFGQSRSGTAFLLSGAHRSYSRLGRHSCIHPVWARRMAISRTRYILV